MSQRTLPAAFIGLLCFALSAAIALPSQAADWTNSGGNAGRNGLSVETGPNGPELAWSGSRTSLIAWLPVIEGQRVITVRQARWPYNQPHDAYVVAHDLLTGEELWAVELPYQSGDWTPWVGGVMNGQVYASRAGNGASVSAPLYALDVADGAILWVSDDLIDAGAYDGMVFAPNGDPVIGSFQDIWRISAVDGSTVWHAPRSGSVSGTCGGALFDDAFYVADVTGGGHILVRYDLATGQRLYQSPVMEGFTIQNTPMVGPDGTVYLNRAQNNPAVDFYYAFTDDGSAFIEKWRLPGMGGATAEFGIGPDGSLYFITAGPRLSRVEPTGGTILESTAILDGFSKARLAVDGQGSVYLSNGAFAQGRLYAYTADLTPRWDVAVTNINIGGPALGPHGTLIVCGVGTDMRAYRTEDPATVAWQEPATPLRLALSPSLVREAAAISYRLPQAAEVRLDLFDAAGRHLHSLLGGAPQEAGEHVLRWEGRDAAGRPLPAGSYHLRLTAGPWRQQSRVLVLR